MNNVHTPPPLPLEDERATRMSVRLDLVSATIETAVSRLRSQIAGHYAWRDRLDAERQQIEASEDKTTQNEIIAVVENRIRRFEHQIATCRHDLSLLRQQGALALANTCANTGDLARILEKYEDSPDYDPTLKERLQGHEALPSFMRPGATSGIARQATLTRFETFAFRGKIMLKAGAICLGLLIAANSINGVSNGNTPGGAKFASPGAGTGFANSVTGAIDNALGSPTQALSRMLAITSGTDVTRLAEDTADTMKTMGTGVRLD